MYLSFKFFKNDGHILVGKTNRLFILILLYIFLYKNYVGQCIYSTIQYGIVCL